MEYEVCLNSDIYKRLSKNLPEEIKQKNLDKLKDIPYIKTLLVKNIRSR